MGTAPALAKDTAGIELAGGAEKAAAAKSEALISAAQNKVVCGREVKMPPQKVLRSKDLKVRLARNNVVAT